MDKKLEKIIDLKLDASGRDAERHGLIQYNYGQILRIHGLDLPPAVEIQFSYREKGGTTENRVGTTKDGVTEVRIPDAMLKNNGTTQDYAIWVFIYVTDKTSGNTVYRIKLYVDSRPAPGEIGEDPDESHILDEAVNAVNAAADRAETAEAEARSAADSATAAAESARKSAEAVAQKKNTAISVIQNRQAAAEKAITDHTDAEIARLDRETQASEDRLTKTIRTANDTKEAAENTISEARRVKESLDISVQNATKEKEAVEASTSTANAAKKNLDQSTADANVAKTALDKTIQSADDQNTSLGEKIETSKQLKTDLQTAGEKATQDIQTAGSEQLGKMQAVAEEFTADREQITTNKEDISSLKEDISELSTSVFEVKESPNIFDKTKINQDKALVTWGTPTMTNYTYDKTGWVTSYPIAVHGGSTIHVYKFENGSIKNQNIANLVTFTKDGSFIAIEGRQKNEIKLSENTAYIIFDISNLTFIDSLMLTTEPYNGVYQEYGRIKEDKIAKIAEDISKINSDKTHIIFSFDAFKIDNRFELMKSYGFPFTIAIAQTILTYPISKDDYYNYFIDGDVDFSVYAGKGNRPADYRSDKDKWSAWVKELVDGLKETSGLYYPVMYSCQNAASSDILNQVVKENGFRMCRNGTYYNADGTTTWGVLTDRKYLIDGTKYFDYYPLSVVKQEGYPTVEQIKAEIDNAIKKKKSIMLFTHYVVDDTKTMSDTDCPLSKFTAVLDYVKEKVDAGLCDVKNARQFWNYYNQQDGLDRDYKRTNMRNLFDTTH